MRRHTLSHLACAAALLTLWQPSAARASDYDRLTYFTFSAPVRIPGATLQAGTYAFEVANPETNRTVLRVTSQHGRKSHGQVFLARDLYRHEATSTPVLVFRETPAGTTPAVRGWFFPTERTGFEFVYSRHEARELDGRASRASTSD